MSLLFTLPKEIENIIYNNVHQILFTNIMDELLSRFHICQFCYEKKYDKFFNDDCSFVCRTCQNDIFNFEEEANGRHYNDGGDIYDNRWEDEEYVLFDFNFNLF